MPSRTAKYRPFLKAITDLNPLPDLGAAPARIWLEAQMLQESSGDPFAIHWDKKAGEGESTSLNRFSVGLMQVENITIAMLLDKYRSPESKPESLAIFFRPLLNIILGMIVHYDNASYLANHNQLTAEALLQMYNSGQPTGDEAYVEAVKTKITDVLQDGAS